MSVADASNLRLRSCLINSTLHVTTAKLLFYMVLFVVTLLKIIDHFKSNLKYKIISLNSHN